MRTNTIYRLLAIVLICLTTPVAAQDNISAPIDAREESLSTIFLLTDYGAVGDGQTINTQAVQKAIDACHGAGGGVVRVPAGEFVIGTIRLKSNVTLSLDHGASLLGSTDHADYPAQGLRHPREGGPHCLIYAEDAENIAIRGLGVIDGRGTPEHFPRVRESGRETSFRPRLLRFEACKNVTFSGVEYRRPAFWGIHLVDCKDVVFRGVKVRFRDNNFNNDGLDIDGCENVLIENCDIDSGDDAICLKSSLHPVRNLVVRDCRVSSHTAPLKFGTSSHGGFIDITVTNCYFYDSPMGAIKLQLVDGGRMENVHISRIVMENVGNPIFIRLGGRGRDYESRRLRSMGQDITPQKMPVGSICNILIEDIDARVTGERPSWAGPIMITGIPGHNVQGVTLRNVTISCPGGGTAEDAAREVPEDIERYPEQFFFGTLPAWGAYIRHANDITFENVQLSTREADARPRLILSDAEGFTEE